MSSSPLSDPIQKLLRCDVCWDESEILEHGPLGLLCGHVICRRCCNKIQKKSTDRGYVTLKCPTCRGDEHSYKSSPPVIYQMRSIGVFVAQNFDNFKELSPCLRCSGAMTPQTDKFCGDCYHESAQNLRKAIDELKVAKESAQKAVAQMQHWERQVLASDAVALKLLADRDLFKPSWEQFKNAASSIKKHLDSLDDKEKSTDWISMAVNGCSSGSSKVANSSQNSHGCCCSQRKRIASTGAQNLADGCSLPKGKKGEETEK